MPASPCQTELGPLSPLSTPASRIFFLKKLLSLTILLLVKTSATQTDERPGDQPGRQLPHPTRHVTLAGVFVYTHVHTHGRGGPGAPLNYSQMHILLCECCPRHHPQTWARSSWD